MPPLSPETKKRVALLFSSEEYKSVCALLQDECGDNLRGINDKDELALERIRFSVLKLSHGDVNKLLAAISLAEEDWRDALVAAGFADEIHAHESWLS